MTQAEIKSQIEAIRRASAEARRTPETARQFLVDAGIIKVAPTSSEKTGNKLKK